MDSIQYTRNTGGLEWHVDSIHRCRHTGFASRRKMRSANMRMCCGCWQRVTVRVRLGVRRKTGLWLHSYTSNIPISQPSSLRNSRVNATQLHLALSQNTMVLNTYWEPYLILASQTWPLRWKVRWAVHIFVLGWENSAPKSHLSRPNCCSINVSSRSDVCICLPAPMKLKMSQSRNVRKISKSIMVYQTVTVQSRRRAWHVEV